MEAIESLDKECSALGGLFQQVVNDMKVRNFIFLKKFLKLNLKIQKEYGWLPNVHILHFI